MAQIPSSRTAVEDCGPRRSMPGPFLEQDERPVRLDLQLELSSSKTNLLRTEEVV